MKKQKRQNKKIILGLTGSFGTGKSTVAKIFSRYGAKIIDADKITHNLLNSRSRVTRKLIKFFGKRIGNKKGGINRRKLGYLVFSKKAALKKLDSFVHPEIIRKIKVNIKASKAKMIILDAPLLIEAGLTGIVNKLIVVKASRNKQLERIVRKHHLTRKDALARIKMQMPLQDKVRMADFVIDNSGTVKETKKQVEKLRRLLWRN